MKTRDIIIAFIILVFTVGLILFYNMNTNRIINKYDKRVEARIDSLLSNYNIPMIISEPSIKDSIGNYTITHDAWSKLEKYILYQANRTEQIVQRSQNEISQDVERLNMWVSIWIGILGLFGAIIPIIVNFAATKGFDKKIESYDTEIKTLKEKAEKITGIESALAKSETALIKTKEIEAIFHLINAFSNLRHIEEFHRVAISFRIKKEEYLVLRLEKLKSSISRCKTEKLSPDKNNVFKDSVQDFLIAFSQFKSILQTRNQQAILVKIDTCFNQLMISNEGNIIECYNNLEKVLEELITSLKK
jgi:hypothetical protein